MKMIKKATTVLLTGIILTGVSVNTYAVTPQYRPPQTDFTIEVIVDEVKDYLKDNPISITNLDTTEITECIYRHSKAFYDQTRLQVRWSGVKNADYYEVKVTKTNGKSKTYMSDYSSLIVKEKSDDFITDCMRSGKVKVRAVSADGKYGEWSKEATISCNSLHRPSYSEIEKIESTKITQAIYYHKKLYFNKARLQVRWSEVPESDYYEIRITKTNGESKVYKTSDTSLFVYNGTDEFIKDCVRSGKVEVRAAKDNDKSSWSDAVTISCNSLHR